MKLVEKKVIEKVIGKANFWVPKQVVAASVYVGGISDMDSKISEKEYFKAPPRVNFKKHKMALNCV